MSGKEATGKFGFSSVHTGLIFFSFFQLRVILREMSWEGGGVAAPRICLPTKTTIALTSLIKLFGTL